MYYKPYSNEERKELLAGIQATEQHLADCREHRATTYLADIMEAWAGTREIDFDYVASILRYSLEEDGQNLARGGIRLLEFQLPED